MKYALTLLLCWPTLLLLAQEERTDYFFHELGSNIVQSYLMTNGEQILSSSSTTWVAGTVIDACRNPSAFYWHNDLELFQTWVYGMDEGDPSNVVEAGWHGDTLILLGIQPCYDGGPAPITRIGKFDTLGNLLTSAFYFGCGEDIGISVEPRLLENTCPVMAVADEGSVLYATTIGLLRVVAGGDLYPQVVNVDIDSLIGLVSLPGTHVGVATRTEVAVVDWATDSILLSLEHAATAMTEADSTFWFISGNSLHRVGTDLSTGAWTLPNEDAEQVRLTTYGEQPLVYAPGELDFNAWLFNPETEAFDLLIDWSLDGVEIFAVEPFREDTFFVSGQLTNGRRGFVKKATPASFAFQQPYDVGISDINLEFLDIDIDVEENVNVYNYRLSFRQTMEVVNYGEGVVDECILEWSTRHDWCDIPGYQVITGLALKPGDVHTITDTMLHVFSTSSPISDSRIYTFNTFGPNHFLDAYPENDTISGGFLITNIEDQSIPSAAFDLFPNPASGRVKLQSDVPIDQLELYDVFGRLLRTQQLEGGHETILERDGLPSGLYLLRLRSGNRYGIRQFIWTNRYR